MKLFLVINEDRFFLSHRLPLAKAALKEGYDVTLVAKDTGRRKECEAAGLRFLDFPVNPTGMDLMQELKTLWWLVRLFRREKPDVVHLVGLKCMLWGGLAAWICRVKVVVNAVSGLGVMFSGEKPGMTAKWMLRLIRLASRRKGVYFIFQNREDKELFARNRVMRKEQCRFAKGSGVDLSEYGYVPEPEDGKIVVIFTARMVKEKGVGDLVSAAEILRPEYVDRVEFRLCGGLSTNPGALRKEDLLRMCDGRYIKWLGYRKDVHEQLKMSHIVAFPSYYREGVPKSLIEAAAVGRPIVTCNSVGCRDVVEDGKSGFLVPTRNALAIARKLKVLIDDKELRQRMGLQGRAIAMRDFSIDKVVKVHLELYRLGKTMED